jgi:hypothetical protein
VSPASSIIDAFHILQPSFQSLCKILFVHHRRYDELGKLKWQSCDRTPDPDLEIDGWIAINSTEQIK